MAFPFEIKKTYNFELYPSSILGNNFQRVTVLGIIDRETAETFTNITTKHPLVFPYLPSGTPNDPDDYTYLKIRHESGIITAIAVEWIQPQTIELVENIDAMVRINNFSPSQISLLREVLVANGFTDFNISTVKK